MNYNFCPRCGTRVTPNEKFCPKCGLQLNGQATGTTGATQENTYQTNQPGEGTGAYGENPYGTAQPHRNASHSFSSNLRNYNAAYGFNPNEATPKPRSYHFAKTGLTAFLTKVYGWVFLSLIVAGISAMMGSRSPLFINGLTPWIMMIAGFVMIFIVYKEAYTNSVAGMFAMMIFAVIEGLSLSGIFVYFTGYDLSIALLSSSVVFGIMSLFGMTTHRDLSKLGTQLFAMVIALLVVSLINILIGSPAIEIFLSAIGVIIFSLYTAFDTQGVCEVYEKHRNSANSVQGLAIVATLQLFLDFINIFIDLLDIISVFSRN